MKRIILYVIIGIFLLTTESSFLSFLSVDFFKPDFGMPLVIYTAFFLGPQIGLVTSLLIGFMQEVFSNAPHGAIVFTKMSIFLIAIFLRNKIYIESKYSFALICSGSVIIESFLFLLLSYLSRGEAANAINILFYTIPNAIFTGLFSIFIFTLINYVNTIFFSED